MDLQDPEAWYDQIERVIESVSGLPVEWGRRRRPHVQGDRVWLSVPAVRNLGTLESGAEFDAAAPAGKEFQPWSFRQTAVTLQCLIESFSSHGSRHAFTYANRIASRMLERSTGSLLCNQNTSVAQILTLQTLDRLHDQRVYSSAVVDVLLNVAVVDRGKPFGYIETVLLSGTVSDCVTDIETGVIPITPL
jgi:hypothetical protein